MRKGKKQVRSVSSLQHGAQRGAQNCDLNGGRPITTIKAIKAVSTEHFHNEKNASRNHYLPHHAVVRKDRETTEVRIVYDGSAKPSKKGNSLNDCLQTGPNYIPQVFT